MGVDGRGRASGARYVPTSAGTVAVMTGTGRDASREPVGRPGPRWGAGERDGAPPEVRWPGLGGVEDVERPEDVEPPAPGSVRPRASEALPYASFLRRLGAFVIDELAKTGLYLVILIVMLILTGDLPAPPAPGEELDLAALAPRLVLSFGYDWIFWSQGWTPGAGVMGIRIVREDGAPPGPARGLVRALVSIPSGAVFFIGYAWMLFSRKRQTWHDMAAGVVVVNVREAVDR